MNKYELKLFSRSSIIDLKEFLAYIITDGITKNFSQHFKTFNNNYDKIIDSLNKKNFRNTELIAEIIENINNKVSYFSMETNKTPWVTDDILVARAINLNDVLSIDKINNFYSLSPLVIKLIEDSYNKQFIFWLDKGDLSAGVGHSFSYTNRTDHYKQIRDSILKSLNKNQEELSSNEKMIIVMDELIKALVTNPVQAYQNKFIYEDDLKSQYNLLVPFYGNYLRFTPKIANGRIITFFLK